jgi:hypothetical protein
MMVVLELLIMSRDYMSIVRMSESETLRMLEQGRDGGINVTKERRQPSAQEIDRGIKANGQGPPLLTGR